MAESKGSSKKSSSQKSSSNQKSSSSQKKSSSQKSSSGSGNRGSKREKLSMRETVVSAIEQVQDLIGRPVESVTGVEKNGNEWTVTLEVLELERVPNTTDVLGKYEVTVDGDGDVTGAQRVRRYPRAEAGEV